MEKASKDAGTTTDRKKKLCSCSARFCLHAVLDIKSAFHLQDGRHCIARYDV